MAKGKKGDATLKGKKGDATLNFAKRTAIGKVVGKQLEIHVVENPVRGKKATAHLVQFLAEEFQVPKSAITVVFGVYNVNKRLRINVPKRLPSVIPAPSEQGWIF